jgi:hypothetical protein
MKKLLAALLIAAGMALPAVVASPANADTPNYVSKVEFQRIAQGMKMSRVHAIFDVNGKQTWYYQQLDWGYCEDGDLFWCAEQSRDYRVKSKWGSVTVDFARSHDRGWVVTGKSAYWG